MMIKLEISPHIAIAHRKELYTLGKIRDGLRARGYDADLFHIQKAHEWFRDEYYGRCITMVGDNIADGLIDTLLSYMIASNGN